MRNKILILDEHPGQVNRLVNYLKENFKDFEVEEFETPQAFMEFFNSNINRIKGTSIDLMMPDPNNPRSRDLAGFVVLEGIVSNLEGINCCVYSNLGEPKYIEQTNRLNVKFFQKARGEYINVANFLVYDNSATRK